MLEREDERPIGAYFATDGLVEARSFSISQGVLQRSGSGAQDKLAISQLAQSSA
jgi:hypothetical protein